jgi:hypothetical protein
MWRTPSPNSQFSIGGSVVNPTPPRGKRNSFELFCDELHFNSRRTIQQRYFAHRGLSPYDQSSVQCTESLATLSHAALGEVCA